MTAPAPRRSGNHLGLRTPVARYSGRTATSLRATRRSAWPFHGKAMLTGELREVKSRYGRNNVQLEYEGQDGFLNDAELVQSFNNYGKYVEVRMKPEADAQKLLHKAPATSRIT